MIGLKTVFNYIKFANELINKIFFSCSTSQEKTK